MPSPSMDVHIYTHMCTHTHMHSSGWCTSSPASFYPYILAILHQCDSIIHNQVLKQKCLYPLHFLHFFPLLVLYRLFTFCKVLFVEWPFRRNWVFLWACLLFEYPRFFLSYSLLSHGLSTALMDSPRTQISPLSGGLQTRSSSWLFCLCWKSFLFSFALTEGLSVASCDFVWSGFWAMCSVPGLCGQGEYRGLCSLVNLHVQVAADHSAPLLQDSTAAALLFCPEKSCPKNFFGKEDEGSNPCPFWILWNHPEKPPCRSSVSWDLCEQQVLSQQIQICRKIFSKCQAISS